MDRCLVPPRAARYDAVAVGDLALRELLERDREVVLGRRVHHRRRELLENSLAERVVVVVDLPRALRRDDHCGVVGVGMFEKLVYARMDQCVSLLACAE